MHAQGLGVSSARAWAIAHEQEHWNGTEQGSMNEWSLELACPSALKATCSSGSVFEIDVSAQPIVMSICCIQIQMLVTRPPLLPSPATNCFYEYFIRVFWLVQREFAAWILTLTPFTTTHSIMQHCCFLFFDKFRLR